MMDEIVKYDKLLLTTAYIDSLQVFHLREIWRRNKNNVGRKVCGSQHLQRLRLHVQNGYEALSVYVAYRLQLGAVHGIFVSSVLQVFIIGNVAHHFLVSHKIVVLAVLLVFFRQPGRVY